jgi:hypothetical protein
MRKHTPADSEDIRANTGPPPGAGLVHARLPSRLMTAFDFAEFVGCHEETVRRAYVRGQLVWQRFGVRGTRFHPSDVLAWIKRGGAVNSSQSRRKDGTTAVSQNDVATGEGGGVTRGRERAFRQPR